MLDPKGAKCHHVRPILKQIDENFEVAFNYETEKYHITYNDAPFQTVPYGELTRELFDDIRHTVWLNRRGEILSYVDAQNEKMEAAEERRQSNMAEALAHDLRRPLIESHLYGR
jgi:signal transduction histidine kinase